MSSVWATPAANAPLSERSAFLRKVGGLTLAGLSTSAVAAIVSSFAIAMTPVLMTRPASLAIILGSWGLTNFVFGGMVNGDGSRGTKLAGFFGGSVSQGIALGYMLLVAASVAAQDGMNPLTIIFQAMALTGLTALGMFGWLMSGPKDLSMVRGAIMMAGLPMLGVMLLTIVWPVGGILGIVISAAFVVISTAGLLYQLNLVMHEMPTTAWVEGSYKITLGLLVLFWNLLSLLSRRR